MTLVMFWKASRVASAASFCLRGVGCAVFLRHYCCAENYFTCLMPALVLKAFRFGGIFNFAVRWVVSFFRGIKCTLLRRMSFRTLASPILLLLLLVLHLSARPHRAHHKQPPQPKLPLLSNRRFNRWLLVVNSGGGGGGVGRGGRRGGGGGDRGGDGGGGERARTASCCRGEASAVHSSKAIRPTCDEWNAFPGGLAFVFTHLARPRRSRLRQWDIFFFLSFFVFRVRAGAHYVPRGKCKGASPSVPSAGGTCTASLDQQQLNRRVQDPLLFVVAPLALVRTGGRYNSVQGNS